MSKKLREAYALRQSPLYRLRGKGQFTSVIGLTWEAVDRLLVKENYRVWTNSKGREIQQPIGVMASVHQRIGSLLARIEVPDYVYSQKGRSYSDNAQQHLALTPLFKTDIHKFYPSTSWVMVYRMFVEQFECAEDIAHRLADICCYQKKHLPTGSALSGRVAFFAAREMFDAVDLAAKREGCRMTAYVDDVTVSGDRATKRLLGEVRQLVHMHGLKTKDKKSRTYSPSAPKAVTGVIVHAGQLLLPNRRHKRIAEARLEVQVATGEQKTRALKVLEGRLQEAKQVRVR